MKRFGKIFALLLTVLLLFALCACGNTVDEPVDGGYTETNDPPTQEEAACFAQAVADTEYGDYTLISILGTQVVAGRNYRFLCETPEGEQKVVTVYRDLEDNCSVSSVINAK